MKLEDLILNDQVKSMRFTNADGRWEVTETEWLNPDNSIVVKAIMIHDPPLANPVEKTFLLECDEVNLEEGILSCKAMAEELEVEEKETVREFKPTEYAEKFQTEIIIEKVKIQWTWILVGCATLYLLFVK